MQETRIAADIAALRGRCRDTRELYREVCGLLFFRYGITPTANRLYQYVRKGSMSTPAQVLAAFWDALREQTRMRIDHPGLPDDLRDLAGTLALQLWSRAQHAAVQGLAVRAAEVESLVAAMRAEADVAIARAEGLEAELDAARAALPLAEAALGRARDEALEYGHALATIRGRLASMGEMLVDQGEEMRLLRAALAASRAPTAAASGNARAPTSPRARRKRRVTS